MKQVLTIAGSDSGGGAGIQADIKAMSANGVYAMSAITSITAQNTNGVVSVHDLPIKVIEAQIDAVFEDFDVAAVKTGMLSSAQIVDA
ncbi:MAG: bifunctional hydroxymethylpyrimidine kinase/phosphomethylpyrimidine kinase, partial [Nitrospirota bacterium]|nr:bifunctional hydroxymethylpyrimidine kinase/phosphomethylpyrimidine kinase [Nitrospirota bacterium]